MDRALQSPAGRAGSPPGRDARGAPVSSAPGEAGFSPGVWGGFDEIGGLVVVRPAALALRSRGRPEVAAATGLAGFALVGVMPADWMPGARFAPPPAAGRYVLLRRRGALPHAGAAASAPAEAPEPASPRAAPAAPSPTSP